MKKIMVIIMMLFLVGCGNNISPEKELYLSMVDELNGINLFHLGPPCDIEISYDDLGNEFIYRVIIDNPSEEMYNIRAVAVHDLETDDIFPSIGVFDDTVSMKPDVVNDEYIQGIVLNGYMSDISEISVMIVYEDSEGAEQTIYYIN